MYSLNKLECEVLNRLSQKNPELKKHIPYLRVKNRELTGVGMYVNFTYIDSEKPVKKLNIQNASLSTNENIKIKGLKYGLGFELYIAKGRIQFIEFVTYGEEWDGSAMGFSFVKES